MSRTDQRTESGISFANVAFASSITLFPLFLSFLQEFAPPQIIYSRDLVPLLLAPWTSPSSPSRVLSRLFQSVLLFRLPKNTVLPCYLLWIAIALTRTLVGFLLSRSVGWAYPRLFNHWWRGSSLGQTLPRRGSRTDTRWWTLATRQEDSTYGASSHCARTLGTAQRDSARARTQAQLPLPHWALYESCGGCGPPLVAYMIVSGVRPDLTVLLSYLKGHKWQVTETLVLLIVCMLLAALDSAPWTYGVAIWLALLVITLRALFSSLHPAQAYSSSDLHYGFPQKRHRADIQMSFCLLAFILLPNLIFPFLTSPPIPQMPSPPRDGVPFLEIVILSYPRPNDTPSSPDQESILSQTISSYLPHVSPSTALSVFTHVAPSKHPSFLHAQHHFQDAPITFYTDDDTHPDTYAGQHLHLAEAFRWITDKDARGAEWVMVIEDDFPLCGEWGWHGMLRVMQALARGHLIPSPETTKMWGGFVGTGGSGLILHRTLLPILAQTLRVYALAKSPFPAFMTCRPADIIVQDCLLGFDPLCPTATSSRDAVEGIWFTRKRPTMVISSRLIMDHIGGSASTAKGRVYDPNKWKCGWRHPFHGRPEVAVVPV